MFVFFFKQKTAYEMRISDWSSDVCSSDLGDRRDEGAWRHDHLIVGAAAIGAADAEPLQREIERDRTVGDRDGMVALRPGGELPLKGAAFLASPIVDAVGQQDGGNGIRFFLRETWPGREGGVEHVSFSGECGRGCRPRLRLEEHPW